MDALGRVALGYMALGMAMLALRRADAEALQAQLGESAFLSKALGEAEQALKVRERYCNIVPYDDTLLLVCCCACPDPELLTPLPRAHRSLPSFESTPSIYQTHFIFAQDARSAWHRAESALHEMSRARHEAEGGKLQLLEALVRERAARILAQQASWTFEVFSPCFE